MSAKWLVWLMMSGAVAAACSSSDVGEKFPSSDSFCSAKAEEECSGVAAVCGATPEACKQKRVPICMQAGNAASGGGRTYKASNAENCVNKTRELYAAKTVDPVKEKEQIEVCERVFAGATAVNAPCETDYQCTGTLVCDKGLCSEKVSRGQGAACNNPGEVCETGSYCGAQGAVKFCLAKKGAGELCLIPDVPCKEDLRCAGNCKPKFNAGEVCGSSDECAAAAPFCDPDSKKCIARSFAAGTPACKEFGGF